MKTVWQNSEMLMIPRFAPHSSSLLGKNRTVEVFFLRRALLLLCCSCMILTLLSFAQITYANSKDEVRISVSVSPASLFISTLTFHDKHFATQLLTRNQFRQHLSHIGSEQF
ncbi:hypothetical protein [Brevibacillus reuszeri]|uniref:hypothetical protein n=1 Tax=Brevibacillus reuszeri TaxID=54915 RepID=UPI001F3277B6|nr:hypothetical protein [Brevibacillus reuszeri]